MSFIINIALNMRSENRVKTKHLTFNEFVELESVKYFFDQYSEISYKNISQNKHGWGGTRKSYSYALKKFQNQD